MARGLHQWLLNKLYDGLGNPPLHLSLWDGATAGPAPDQAVAAVRIGDHRVLMGLIINPELYFGEAYSSGRIEIDGNLVACLEEAYRALERRNGKSFLLRHLRHWQARPRANTRRGSRSNIHHHYDIGNDFYRLWLDPEMLYTCAYYPRRTDSLEVAQMAKIHHIARKLQLKHGEKVVEAGCGWGSLAINLAKHYGVKVRAYNISHQQILYARARAKSEGLQDRVEFIEDDYRNIRGDYDVFVSVGMLEHVGLDNYATLGEVICNSIKAEGRGLIHSIGRNRPLRMNPWIERRIFPGAYPPAIREMMGIFEPHNLSVLDVENIRLHYARTLQHWLQRFDVHQDKIRAMFDEQFVRTWRLYLAGSISGFTTGAMQLFQIVFAPGHSNRIPWTRAYMYADGPAETNAEAKWKRAM